MYKMQAAIVGTGYMGSSHLDGLKRIDVLVRGVLGSSPQKGQGFASEYNLPKAYATFDDLLSDPKVDVVHICTPNRAHYPMAKAALEAGKHVVMEKPLTMNSIESADLLALARRTGLAAVVNHNLRFFPRTLQAHALTRAGDLGEIHLLQGGYCQDWLFPSERWDWRLLPEIGGPTRVVSDIGSHWLDITTWITGSEVVELAARTAIFTPQRVNPVTGIPLRVETEDAATVIARYANGMLGTVTLSQSSPGRDNHFWFELTGAKSSLLWDQEKPDELWSGKNEGGMSSWLMEDAPYTPEVKAILTLPDGEASKFNDTFPVLYQMVYGALEKGNLPDERIVPTFRDGHRGMVLVDAILEASKSQQWVKVNQTW